MDRRELIEQLRERTTEHGCTPAEEDAAALKIGKLIMKYGLTELLAVSQANPKNTLAEEWKHFQADLQRRRNQAMNMQTPYGSYFHVPGRSRYPWE